MTKRFYAPYTEWEDHKHGMFGKEVKEHQIANSLNLLSRPKDLVFQMKSVVILWPVCAKHNLTNVSSNRRSWLGQAACCFTHGSTEFETRMAWRELTKEQQIAANQCADEAISMWETKHKFNKNEFIKEDFTL